VPAPVPVPVPVQSTPPASADALLSQFAVYGRFYQRPIAGVPELLRDRLEIAPHDWPLSDCVTGEPDLLVVMMNPGASRPLATLWDVPETAQKACNDSRRTVEPVAAQAGFVAAQPDRTQYQIMQLMIAAQAMGKNWQHARILNLSDLRTPKSAVFIEKLGAYAEDDSHSLFSAARRQECADLFADQRTPVLCAWGLSPHFASLAKRALASVTGHPILGLTADGVAYRHPLPQRHDLQLQWLADMRLQVASLPPSRDTA
jgi:hypothetical protein